MPTHLSNSTPSRPGEAALPAVDDTPADEPRVDEAHISSELLVEEVSIDGMCGVY